MDASELFPRGFHPAATYLTPDCHEFVKPLRRRDSPSLKYHFIDFGISSYFPDSAGPHRVVGSAAQDRTVPELSDTEPYDPFMVDIYTLGHVYKMTFLDVFSNLDFLQPLVEKMMRSDPRARPSAAQAQAQFHDILQQLQSVQQRLRRRDETVVSALWLDAAVVSEQLLDSLKSISAPSLLFVGVFLSGSLLAVLPWRRSLVPRIYSLFRR